VQVTSSGSRQPDSGPEADPRRWKALSVALVAGFMALLDVSIVNVALPSIRANLGADEADLQWVVSGYALAFGLVLVPAGRFGDARGRRNAFVLGVALFTLSSAAAGLAPNPTFLVIARLLQGIGGGLINPQVSGLIQQMFRPAERGRPFGFLGATIGLSTAVGPLLGGLLIFLSGSDAGWRWVFFVNVPIGVVAVVLAMRFFPKHVPGRRESLDPLGVVLLGIGTFLVLLPLVQERTWSGNAKWLLLVPAVAVLTAFVCWQRWYGRRASSLVDLDLFQVRSYALGSTIGLLYFAGFTAIFFVYTLYLQNGLGYSALEAGLASTPFALGSAVGSAAAGRVVMRVGRRLVAGGLVAVLVGVGVTAVLVATLPPRDVPLAVALPLLLAGLGSGCVISPNITLTLTEVPVRRAGSAGAVVQTGQRLGSAMGIAVVGAVFFGDLVGRRPDWSHALEQALLAVLGFVVLSLVVALVDVLGRHGEPDQRAAPDRARAGSGAPRAAAP
jgi:EmrB/QacA subfamily drug resistance transporter